jgi:hypothetical protein
MILILLIIKESLKDNDWFKPTVVPAKYPEASLKTFSFLDYITAVNKTDRQCIQMPNAVKFELVKEGQFSNADCMISGVNPVNWPVPFLKCDYRECNRTLCNENVPQNASSFCSVNILALAPVDEDDRDRMEAFEKYILETYPQIEDLNMIKTFNSSQKIDDYVLDTEYGNTTLSKPKIAVAVILGGSGKDYEYTIRTNSTNFNSLEFAARAAMPTNPNTKRNFDSTARDAKKVCELEGGTSSIGKMQDRCTVQYMYNGALTIQRLVDDFIIQKTGAKDKGFYVAESAISFVDFPVSACYFLIELRMQFSASTVIMSNLNIHCI